MFTCKPESLWAFIRSSRFHVNLKFPIIFSSNQTDRLWLHGRRCTFSVQEKYAMTACHYTDTRQHVVSERKQQRV